MQNSVNIPLKKDNGNLIGLLRFCVFQMIEIIDRVAIRVANGKAIGFVIATLMQRKGKEKKSV